LTARLEGFGLAVEFFFHSIGVFRGHLQHHGQIIALVLQGVREIIGVFRRHGQHDFQVLVGLLERLDATAQRRDFS
jgi:hypothetical protein